MVAVLAAIGISALCPARADPPIRIVSLNLCTDQILVDLVPRARIAAVTTLAIDPTVSASPEKFAGLATTRGLAEDVLARDPDLIIAGAYTTPATVDLLRRLGRRVVVVPLPGSVAGVREVITSLANAVEEPAAGARLVAEMEARINSVRTRVAAISPRPSALVYQANNYTAGRGTLVEEALDIAGYRNASGTIRSFANGQTALETIIAAPPDVMILASEPGDATSTAAANLRHPALARLLVHMPHMVLPWSQWLCGTHTIATAIERLADGQAMVVRPPSRQP